MNKVSWSDPNSFHPSYEKHKAGYLLLAFSHVFNLVPLYFAITEGFPNWFLLVIIFQMIFSLFYHLFFTNKALRFADWLFSLTLIISNVIILLTIHSDFFTYKIALLIVLVLCSIKPFMQFKNYALNHTIWHIIAALITRVVLL
jgi:hypothetical protein